MPVSPSGGTSGHLLLSLSKQAGRADTAQIAPGASESPPFRPPFHAVKGLGHPAEHGKGHGQHLPVAHEEGRGQHLRVEDHQGLVLAVGHSAELRTATHILPTTGYM